MNKNLILTILFLTVYILSFAQSGNKNFDLDDVLTKGVFRAKRVYGIKSMNDGKHYTTIESKGTTIVKHEYLSGDSITCLLNLKQLNDSAVSYIYDYAFNFDESLILIQSNYKPIYRRSFKADFFIYSVKNKTLTPVSKNGSQQLATFSPNGNYIAFIRDNNIFITNLRTSIEKQVTFDGELNKIINGAPDWVYEEEFEFNKAFIWSADSKNLAFLRFDESDVKLFNMTLFESSHPNIKQNALYPENYTFKYPKAGENNSIVSLHVFNLEDSKIEKVDVGQNTDQYLPRLGIINNNFYFLRLNRLQNFLEIIEVDNNTNNIKILYSEENKYYIDEKNFDNIQFINNGKDILLTSEKDGFNHIYIFNINKNELKQVTKGNYDITELYGYDNYRKKILYQAAMVSPTQRELYEVDVNGKNIKCISQQKGINEALFSTNYNYFIKVFNSSTTPFHYSLCDKNGNEIRVIENNNALNETIKNYKFNLKKFFTFTTSSDINLNGLIIFPPNFDSSQVYPIVMNQYSGPNSQEVTDTWSMGYDEYLAQEGFIIVKVDPRGTGARGETFRKSTYKQLGKFETIDQIEAAKYLKTLKFVDPDRIAIWGWSFGGYISSSCMVKGNGMFKVGVAVAPVTNWRYYDNIYTERFMQKPQDNNDGYDDNSPINFADKLQGKLLLVHGSADDNVHLQNTLEFAEKLVQANKQFDMMIYNNKNHGIYGGNTRTHLFTMITNYFKDNL